MSSNLQSCLANCEMSDSEMKCEVRRIGLIATKCNTRDCAQARIKKVQNCDESWKEKHWSEGGKKYFDVGRIIDWSIIALLYPAHTVSMRRRRRKTAHQLSYLSVFICFLTILFFCVPGVTSVRECMSGMKIDCFSCNSWVDPRCNDPFNYTTFLEDMPPNILCEGCCVKLVTKAGTPLQGVIRTCTDKMDINLFMVDHVCMTEGGENGHMCFCEEDNCNQAITTKTHPAVLILASIELMLLL